MNKHALADLAVEKGSSGQNASAGFPVGTKVRTEHGERSVETLQPGDRVVTRYGKLVKVKSVERTQPSASDVPIAIEKDALGPGLPRRDVMVASDQQILCADPLLERLFDCTTAVMNARDLLELDGVAQSTEVTPLAFVKVNCEGPEVLFCSGLSCISQAAGETYDRAPTLCAEMTKAYFAQL